MPQGLCHCIFAIIQILLSKCYDAAIGGVEHNRQKIFDSSPSIFPAISSRIGTMATSFETLPIIDFQALENEATKLEALEKLKHALFNVGFLYLANTGLEASCPFHSRSDARL